MKRRTLLAAVVVLALVGGIAPLAQAQMKLQFYYPVGVAGRSRESSTAMQAGVEQDASSDPGRAGVRRQLHGGLR